MQFHLLTALHPTAAVCGQPRDLAKRFLKENGEVVTHTVVICLSEDILYALLLYNIF
jgi:hypothetical protein